MTLAGDLSHALKALLHRPAYAAAGIATLAVALAANAAVFATVNALFLKPLPFPDGDRLVQVFNQYPASGLDFAGTSVPDFLDRREQAEALEALAIYTGNQYTLGRSGRPARLTGVVASPELFDVLGVEPVLGRRYTAEDAAPGRSDVVVLSHVAWQTHFGGRRGIVGESVVLDDRPFRVIGVMPEGFGFPSRQAELWTPFVITPENGADTERGNEYSNTIGRLAAGASIEQLNAQLDAIVRNNADRFAASSDPRAREFAAFLDTGNFRGRAVSLREQWVGDLEPAMALLQAAVAVVLLIACANVANLSLAELTRRERELAVRAAVGAGRRRMTGQLLSESLILALVGGALGLGLAVAGMRALTLAGLDRTARGLTPGLDATVVAFGLASALVAGLLAAAFPIYRVWRGARFEALKEGGRAAGAATATLAIRNGLTVAQVGLATALVFGAGLLIQSFDRLQSEDPGFDPRGVVAGDVQLPVSRYPDAEARAQFYAAVIERVRALPAVRAAAWSGIVPFSGHRAQSSYLIEGREIPAGQSLPHGHVRIVGPGYFETLGVPLLAGRIFTDTDGPAKEPVVVIDRVLAERHFPDQDPIGQRLRPNSDGDPLWWRVIGVVGSAKHAALDERTDKETYYLPLAQNMRSAMNLVVKTDAPPSTLVEPMRRAVLAEDDQVPLGPVHTLDEHIARSLADRRAPMVLLVAFGAGALLLAGLGVFAVMAYTVAQRTGEVGLRMALGADNRQVAALVMRRAGGLTLSGLVLGALLAAGLGLWLRNQLYGVSPLDPALLTTAIVLLALVAVAAAYLPLRRALGVQPTEALRYE